MGAKRPHKSRKATTESLNLDSPFERLTSLARAMFGNPKFIVLDEPNSNLDGDSEAALLRALQELRQRGITVVLVSHRPVLVQGVEKVLLMRDGAVEMFGPRAEVLKKIMKPAHPTPIPAPATQPEGREAQA